MSTFSTLAICFILITIGWTIMLLPTIRESRARFLVIMVGLVAGFHGLRLLTGEGMAELPVVQAYHGVVDLVVASLTYLALVILHAETSYHQATRVRLRLSQAAEAPAPHSREQAVSEVLELKDPSHLPDEVKLDRLMQASPVAIVALDEHGRVCSCNASAETLFQVRPGDLLGRPLPSIEPAAGRGGEPGNLNPAEANS